MLNCSLGKDQSALNINRLLVTKLPFFLRWKVFSSIDRKQDRFTGALNAALFPQRLGPIPESGYPSRKQPFQCDL